MNISGFLCFALSWKEGQKLGKLSVINQVLTGVKATEVGVWLPRLVPAGCGSGF